ncbi:MAG: 4-(cytidine 5'-diphospho)-2-C-methyl-D-erythritol kinase [Dehalococcoidia bacterium]|nr:4-(cytidine 5'-diphospho)-2-C-methyl-D-erythritol kinase [Dehalococcoidia bacterium]
MRISTFAPAKVNWTLEALRRRDDGYHEVATVLQTIDLADRVVVSPDEELRLSVRGRVEGLPAVPEENLAQRAATALLEAAGDRQRGALIELEKVVPAAAGLGGGSSDAAAVLRALNALWGLGLSVGELASIGAKLGADVPFFLHGGTARAGGRGEEVTPLPDSPQCRLLLVVPHTLIPRKTALMYARLTPEHYTDGSRTAALVEKLRGGEPVGDGDLYNVFEKVVSDVVPAATEAMTLAGTIGSNRPHLAGSGPAFFFLLCPGETTQEYLDRLAAAGLDLFLVGTLEATPATALRVEE